jgi:prepilin-type N-terminal cleavage/methylation domain-containing protein
MRINKGFTLVELLVTIAIIATLSAILLPNFMGARQKAEDSKKIQDMVAIKNALRLYYNDHQSYYGAADNAQYTDLDTGLATYMTPVGIGFTYCRTNSGDGFLLYTHLSSSQGTDAVSSQTQCGVTSPVCGLSVTLPSSSLYFVCAK